MKTVNVEISASSLSAIIEKACDVYRKELFEAEDMDEVKRVFYGLDDVIRLWEAFDDNFDCDEELLLTLERREVQEDGADHAD